MPEGLSSQAPERSQPAGRSHQQRRAWRRALARYRRLLVAGLVAAATASALHALAPPAAATVVVLVAARDLAAGHTLAAADLRAAGWPAGVPLRGAIGAARPPVGRILASPLRAGEPVTDVRLSGPGLLAGQPAGTRALTVRVHDPAGVAMVRPGDRVDVLADATTEGPLDIAQSGAARQSGVVAQSDVVVQSGVVLVVPGVADGAGSRQGSDGDGLSALTGASGVAADGRAGLPEGVILLAVDADAARRLAAVRQDQSLTVVLRAPG